MAELETAQRRLSEALQRLQSALERRSTVSISPDDDLLAGADRDDLARHVVLLRSECERLSAALSEAQRDSENLRRVSTQVARRLDGSIAEIDRMIGG